MYLVAFISFIFAALLGLTMAVMHFRGVESGKALGLAHGFFALSGVALLASGLFRLNASGAWWIVATFGVVALGGAYLFSRQVQDKPWPAAVIIAHGGLAIVTIVWLGVWMGTREEPRATDGSVPSQTTENEAIPVEELIDE